MVEKVLSRGRGCCVDCEDDRAGGHRVTRESDMTMNRSRAEDLVMYGIRERSDRRKSEE